MTSVKNINFAHYGEARDLGATDSELQLFEALSDMVAPRSLDLVRTSDNYLTAKLGDWDFARFKYTERTAWILFPVVERPRDKHKISAPAEVRDFADMAANSIAHIEKYSK